MSAPKFKYKSESNEALDNEALAAQVADQQNDFVDGACSLEYMQSQNGARADMGQEQSNAEADLLRLLTEWTADEQGDEEACDIQLRNETAQAYLPEEREDLEGSAVLGLGFLTATYLAADACNH